LTGGSVRSGDGEIDCPTECSGTPAKSSTITLTATANDGFALDHWEGCDSTSESECRVTLHTNRSVAAVFAAVPSTVTLTVAARDAAGASVGGTVTSDDGTIDCPTTCSGDFDAGTSVRLTATPNEGYTLDHWEGCDSTSDSACDLTLQQSRTVTAVFAAVPSAVTLTVTVAARGAAGGDVGGTVTSDDGTIDCPTTCSGDFDAGTSIALTASPDEGSVFKFWEGCPLAVGPDCTLTLDSDTEVTAVFRSPALVLKVSGGTVTYGPDKLACPDTCTASYPGGTSITMTATPADPSAEFTVVDWGGACAGTPRDSTTCSITLREDTSVSAHISGRA
jgi:hypothetical protein